MSLALWTLAGVVLAGMLLRMPIGFSMLLGLLVAMTVFPEIVLWLPRTMGYGVA